jgi:hypothetical protein
MSDTGIDVYIPEPGSGPGDENGLFKRRLESEFTAPFHFVSIGRGAAAAAWVTEVVSFAETYGGYGIGVVIAAFFAGEKIEKGLDVWPRLYQRLKSTFHHQPTFDREGAAVLIANEISQRLGEPPTYIRCNGFQIADRAAGTFAAIPEAMLLTAISPRQRDKVSNRDVYYFDVDVNNRRFLGRVSFDNLQS